MEINGGSSATVHGVLGWFNVEDYGAKHDGATDDSAAIQAAINACYNAGGGTVYFPNGVYSLSGALGGTAGNNGILYIPDHSTSQQQITIELLGQTPPPRDYWAMSGGKPAPTTGVSVLYGKTAASGTTPSILATPQASANASGFTNIFVKQKNLIYRQTPNPGLLCSDMRHASAASYESCCFDVDALLGSGVTAPTNTNGYGCLTPFNSNGAYTLIRDCFAIGYYTGFHICEHTVCDNLSAALCSTSYALRGPNYHSIYMNRILSQWSTDHLGGTGTGNSYVRCEMFDIEDAPSGNWYTTANHIQDPNNYLYGFVYAHRVLANSGPETGNLTLNGGANLSIGTI